MLEVDVCVLGHQYDLPGDRVVWGLASHVFHATNLGTEPLSRIRVFDFSQLVHSQTVMSSAPDVTGWAEFSERINGLHIGELAEESWGFSVSWSQSRGPKAFCRRSSQMQHQPRVEPEQHSIADLCCMTRKDP